jgi:flagellar biosynthesis/type III secretory pathway protein FliH
MVSAPIGNADTDYRRFELESLDLLELAPWLILQSAQEQAGEIIAQAALQADTLRQQASRESAVADRERAMQELLPALAALANAGQSLIAFEEQLLSRCAPQLVDLALEIAAKVIAKAVDADAEIVAAVLERAKHEALDAKQLRIWLNPTDHRLLAELRPDLVKIGSDGKRTIKIVASDEIARGGCRLESESGIVDATLPTQIDEIRRQLLDTEL